MTLTGFIGTVCMFPMRAIIAAMYEWWRKAELSADRAGLLVNDVIVSIADQNVASVADSL